LGPSPARAGVNLRLRFEALIEAERGQARLRYSFVRKRAVGRS
jgi:hypothetical protein